MGRRPDATREAFVDLGDGLRWFRTGDSVAVARNDLAHVDVPITFDSHSAWSFRILGRLSADIFKVSSYKVSALEIETVLLESGFVDEVAVFAAESHEATLSDVIVAPIVPSGVCNDRASWIDRISQYASNTLPKYKRPHSYVVAGASGI